MKPNIPYGYKIYLYTRSLTDEGFKGFDIDFLMEGENEAKGRKKRISFSLNVPLHHRNVRSL
ncbi:hypothetical protein LQV63_01605 [Paenibacillus profundus]|uniref:Uncharacterized protein n=1 Tax=Paenibacillus profundus TaxID=1173085 RepID=A0ABS8YA42_9BACL|nr:MULTISPECIES: hypothetical protein [Paenibacillus]MCE5168014.1 hypothetical protein [Paenibacillus profundus]